MKRLVRRGLLTQMLVGQALIVMVTGLILIGTALLLAPTIFNKHLSEAGITSESARLHVSEAFSTAMTISLGVAALASLIVSGTIGWYFMLRIVSPIEEMASFASSLAAGTADLPATFTVANAEFDQLATALVDMSRDLALSKEEQARMLGDLAHELRTPISTIGAIVDGIEDGVVPASLESWQTIRKQLERLNRLSHDVRDVSNNVDQVLSSVKFPHSPSQVCSNAFAAWQQRYEKKGVHFKLDLAETLPLVDMDEHRILQVLSNLLENALRHTSKGGTVTLCADNFTSHVEISVKDTGEGIDAHHLPLIFERLYRADTSRTSGDSGSGLGLTIARSIALAHSGSLVAKSAGPGFGTTVILKLPVT